MGRSKKQSAHRRLTPTPRAGPSQSPEGRPAPVPRPPRPNKPFLLAAVVLFGVWLAFLVWLAFSAGGLVRG